MIHKSRPQKHVQTVKLYMYTSVRSRIVGFMFVLIMEYVRVVKGKGCKYVVNNYLFSQYCIRNSKRYVKCDVCSASGYIDGDKFVAVKPHSQHDDQSQEIQRLQFVDNNSRKRAAEEPTESTRVKNARTVLKIFGNTKNA